MIDYTKINLNTPTVTKPGAFTFEVYQVGNGKFKAYTAERK